MHPESFFHVAFKVGDLEASRDFYRDHLGATVRERGSAEESEAETAVDYVVLEAADKLVYLFERAPYEAAGLVEPLPAGFLHYGFVVDDAVAAYRELSAAGVDFFMEPTEFDDLRICFFEDPDGNTIELIEEVSA